MSQTHRVCMSPLDAARHTAEDYPHGRIQGMALMLGKSYETLRKELAGAPGYKLGLLDAMRIMSRSGDYRIADAMEAEIGRFALPLPNIELTLGDGEELMDHIVRLYKEFSDVLQEVAQRAADGDISDNDLAAVEEQWGQLIAVGDAFMRFLVRANRARKPNAIEGGDAPVR